MSYFCCIPGCDTVKRTSNIHLFKVPHGVKYRGYDTTEWSKSIQNVLFKYCAPDNANFQQHLQRGVAHICSLHFEEADIVRS